jgi:hypothetical protein
LSSHGYLSEAQRTVTQPITTKTSIATCSCEHSNKLSDSINGGECLKQQSDHLLLKKDNHLWSCYDDDDDDDDDDDSFVIVFEKSKKPIRSNQM